ncbi:type IV pilus biogenesis protein PilP [Burkholderia sp. WAC0059]|uniref:type IV pilus biogenesis protein PilP n=1 Tax=Burkholderia sp. WAC0059 TaxID=2066022 RepID=UPI000C7E91A4|nr:type IV pilus biogenesis protein PilP [Burkholderia sp. WAC0059]PLZ00005.1 type IV pilus biogenesis protein PilP [Burkholderia sp. WAC0059]
MFTRSLVLAGMTLALVGAARAAQPSAPMLPATAPATAPAAARIALPVPVGRTPAAPAAVPGALPGQPVTGSPASAVTAATVAAAAPASTPDVPVAIAATADELTQLQDRTVVLEAELKELEAQSQVSAQIAALNGSSDDPSSNGAHVTSVESVGTVHLATMSLRDGSEFEVAPGEHLPDGTLVESIDADGVMLKRPHEKPVRLRVTHQNPDAGPEMSGLPIQPRGGGLGLPAMPPLPRE